MPAKFVLKKGSTGKFRFNLLATNGQVIASSEAYESRAAAMKGIQSVKKNAANADVDDQTAGSSSSGTAKKTAAKKTSAKKTAAKKTAAKKSTAKSTTKKAAAKKSTPRKSSGGGADGEPAAGSTDTVELELGKCHYGGFEEAATVMATREDGTGWIAVCDEHKEQAEQDGFVVNQDS